MAALNVDGRPVTRVWTCGCSYVPGDPSPWGVCERHATSNARPDLTETAPSYDDFVARYTGDAAQATGGEVTT